MLRIIAFFFTLFVIASFVPQAQAQDPPGGGRDQAKAEFAAGQKAFDKRDYAEALTHFRRAFDLHRHDAVRFNIAVCLEKLGRSREAVIEYETAAKSDQLDQAARARATTQAAEARKQLGTLVVEGTPAGAEVLVDGEQLCNVPCKVELDPVRHEVVIQSGAKTEKRGVTIVKQETRTISVGLGAEPTKAAPEAGTSSPSTSPAPVVRDRPEQPSAGGGPGWLTWTGAGLVVLGGAGMAVFGMRAKSAHDDWVETGDQGARDDGVAARNLTNVSIGVAVLGAVAIGVDLLLLAPKRRSAKETAPARVYRGLRVEL